MSRLNQFLADVHARGLRILEHPDYGGVHDWMHMKGSMHAKGRAADINYGPPGAPASERPVLLWAARLADAAGLNVIYAYHRTHPIKRTNDNHRDHLHVDDGPIAAYRPPGRDDALYARILAERPTPAMKARKYHWRETTKATHLYTRGPGRGRGRLLPAGFDFTVMNGSGVKRGLTWWVKTTNGNWIRSGKTRKKG